jgi:peptidyl-dipeptidase Dcp
MRLAHFLIASAAVNAAFVLAAVAARAKPQNPLLGEWKTPFGAPPFAEIKEDHYLPALKEGMARHRREVQAIAKRAAAPTFANTLEALDASGEVLERVHMAFSAVRGAETNDRLQAIAREVAPLLSKHADDIYLDEKLFKRVKAVFDARAKLTLAPDQLRLLEKTYRDFVRGGALLGPPQKERFRAINQELSVLQVKFTDNVLKETNAFKLVIEKRADLAGLPPGVVAAAAQAAKAAGQEGKWVFTLQAPSIGPFLQYARNRELRRRIFEAYVTRCDHGDAADNKQNIARIAALRAERAKLLGYATYADFVLEETMAKTPAGVHGLLDQIWPPALRNAKREVAALQALIDAEKGGFKLQPWDWAYYAEKLRKAKYDLDEEALRPYFPLERVKAGVFDVARRLYGITLRELNGVPTWHPEVKAYEVREADGAHVGVILVDYHPRAGKRPGAWMSYLRKPWTKGGKRVAPIVFNVGNFSRPTADRPALLSPEEVRTLFHEFGHALHGLLTKCRYRSQSGTSVYRDFVELPSQIMENWAMEPAVLRTYARHWKTGAVIPDTVIAKLEQTKVFNQGFKTVELTAAALLDLDWHTLKEAKAPDTAAFERQSLKKMGLIPEIVVRYRSTYFAHVVGGYAAGYYSYLWSAVLDADAFEAFKEKGDLFDPGTARAFRANILEKGGSEEAMDLYRRFRGRAPRVEPLLKRRGLK